MTTRKLTLFLLLMFSVLTTYAQENAAVVNGVVKDNKGNPLEGVSVRAINASTKAGPGTQTNATGTFTFQRLPAGSYSFTFSSVGLQTQTRSGYALRPGESVSIDITLSDSSQTLDQVTVVGYGSQRRRDVTTAVVGIRAKDMENQPINNVAEAMVGKMTGVQVVQGTGQPGTPLSVKVRGVGTITAGTEPLYVIDNVPTSGNNLNTLNTYDIESLEVLKDASSAAIYGSRGSNGVVLITTKQGKRGKPVVAVNSMVGVQSVAHKIDMLDAYGYASLVQDARNNAYSDQMVSNNLRRQAQGLAPIPFTLNDNNATRLVNTSNNTNTIIPVEVVPYLSGTPGLVNTDWQDEIFKKALMQNHSISVSGGSEDFRYYTSLEYLDQDGIIINSNFKRFGARVNLDGNTGIFRFGLNLNPSVTTEKRVNSDGTYTSPEGGGVVSSALHYSPIWPVYNPDGSYSFAQNSWNGDSRTTLPNGTVISGNNQTQAWNPVALAMMQKFNVNALRMLGNVFAEAAFTKDLKYRATFGFDLFNVRTDKFRPSTIPLANTAGNPETNATGSSETGNALNWLVEQTLTYNKKIGEHNFAVLGGWSLQKDDAKSNAAFATSGFISNQIPTLNAGIVTAGNSLQSQWTLASGIARVQYNYSGRYLLTASMRADGSSKFGSNNRWGYFPSVSAGWRLSDEKFLQNSAVISDLKLRASYGLTGNFKIPNYGALGSLSYAAYVFGGATAGSINGAAPSSQPNPNLSWERTAQVNLGLDGGLFGNKLTFAIDYYNSNTTDLLLNVPVPLSTGFSTELVNIGKVNNKGFEVNLGTRQRFRSVTWNASANFSTNKNKVIELGPGNADIINTGSVANAYFITRVGEPIGSYFLPKQLGVFKTQADVNGYPHFIDAASNFDLATSKPGDFKFFDADGDKVIDLTRDRVIIGSYQPKFTYGFATDFEWKGFDLSAAMQGVYGSKILNLARRYFYNHEGNMNNYAGAVNRWKSESDPGSGLNVRANRVGKGQNGITSSWHVEDGSYLRIRNITVGYSIRGGRLQSMGMSRARLYVSLQNPFTITNYQGYNPEVSNRTATTTNGEDYGVYPTAKTISAGINVTF
ncbi:TonB-dependent receptor [Segetibacter sp. 3557_3]|uniref:SusC/RagA family TonB-linked outer membrane protein n=1 Tax=Segetibacter sp. 3557_3 TaxID=2547429 RepID=UPI001058CB41|nr:TonB-dependent receptor [Segetibacter sp. 3557_3]TDH24602.1 TonB-dependent receptor [Segetibacter sp. 3557_3]